jgi:hypothetical protein
VLEIMSVFTFAFLIDTYVLSQHGEISIFDLTKPDTAAAVPSDTVTTVGPTQKFRAHDGNTFVCCTTINLQTGYYQTLWARLASIHCTPSCCLYRVRDILVATIAMPRRLILETLRTRV